MLYFVTLTKNASDILHIKAY